MKRLIVHRDIQERKARLTADEADNYPNGRKTMHTFRTDKKVRDNEQMCERNPDGTFVLSEDEAIGIPPNGKLITKKILALKSKCCRGVYTMSKKQIASIFRVHGEGISTFQGAQAGDEELGIDNDPPFGFDMQDRENGYPCVALLPNGKCGHQEDGKPERCALFPMIQDHLGSGFGIEITTCSVTFDANGNQITKCDGCGAFTPE